MHKRGLCRHAVSVRPSVCLSRSWILSKYRQFFSPLGATPFEFLFFRTKWHGNIPTVTALTGASHTGGLGRNRDSGPTSGSIACCEPFQRQVQYSRLRQPMAS